MLQHPCAAAGQRIENHLVNPILWFLLQHCSLLIWETSRLAAVERDLWLARSISLSFLYNLDFMLQYVLPSLIPP